MHVDLKSTTEAAEHAVFDPAAILHVINDPDVDSKRGDVLEDDVERGNVLLYSNGTDGTATLRVYLEGEPEEDAVAQAAHPKHGLLLHAPSGTLFAAGVECLLRPGREPVTGGEFGSVVKSRGEKVSIPPGDYVVDAFEVRRPDRAPSFLDRLFTRVSCMGCLASVIGSVIALVVPVVAAQQGTDLVWVLFCWGTALAVFWIAVIISHGLLELRPSVRRCRRQLQESRERFPFDAALVLRPIPENVDASSLRGGLFGRGFTQKPVRVEA